MYYLHTTFFGDVGDYDPNYIATIHSTFEEFTGWNIDQVGIATNFTEEVTFKDVYLVNADADTGSIGISSDMYRMKEKVVYDNVSVEGFGTGLALPPQGQITVKCGYFKNGINFSVPNPKLATRDMLFHNVTTELDNAFPNPLEFEMVAEFFPPEDKYTAYVLLPDKIILNYGSHNNQRLFFDEQAADYTPLPVDGEPYTFFEGIRYILARFATKTNQQLQSDFNMSFGGTVIPQNAISDPTISGGKLSPWSNEVLNVPVCIDHVKETRFEETNLCIQSFGTNLVEGPLPIYNHPIKGCNTVGINDDETDGIPTNYVLEQNYPNPFNPVTTIRYAIPEATTVRIDVFDLLGRQVQTLVNEPQSAGTYEVTWNALGENVSVVSSGVYIYRLQTEQTVLSRKMLLLK
ncbi:MAG: T9SS type A sorting domain-containing protein [Calditrichota bacterium]